MLVTASNNYQKERQFRAIEEKEKEFCTVVRNNVETVLVADEVVVGMPLISMYLCQKLFCYNPIRTQVDTLVSVLYLMQ